MARNKRRKIREPRQTYSIIGDGQTEKWYFELMKLHETLPRIDLKPELPVKRKLKNLFDQAIENAKDYDKVFLIFDLDAILHNNQIDDFKKYLGKVKKNKKIQVLVNNPCLEFWFLLHFVQTSRYFPICTDAEDELRRNGRIENYRKTEKFFKQAQEDIYHLLKPFQINAIAHASDLGDFDYKNIQSAKAEIYKVVAFLVQN